MSVSQLAQSGSQSQKQKARRYAPIWVGRFTSGYWPNRNPLRDASLPVLQEKFYGSLNDALIDGQDCELNTRSELTRRAGNSVFNSHTFGPQQRFYSYPIFGTQGTPFRRLLTSSATQIVDITNNGNTLLYTKPAGAGKTTFQAVGNTLFFGDGVTCKQLLGFDSSWQSSTLFQPGTQIIDTNGNVQNNLGYAVDFNSVGVTNVNGSLTIVIAYVASSPVTVGASVTFTTVNTPAVGFLNGTTQVITAVNLGLQTFTFQVSGTTATGTYTPTGLGHSYLPGSPATSGGSAPAWNASIGGYTSDGFILWINSGVPLRPIGITAPTTAPIVANTPAPTTTVGQWAASTYFFPGQVIYDSVGNTVQQLTNGPGNTAGAPPVFATTIGTTTTDGAVTWNCIASGNSGSTSAIRAANTAYAIGAYVNATWSVTIQHGTIKVGGQFQPFYITINYAAFFMCTTAGTTSATTTGNLTWALSGTVNDGSVIWTFIGLQVKRGASTLSPSITTTAFTAGSIGNTQAVSPYGSPAIYSPASALIDDSLSSGSGPGNYQQIILAGKSGASHPTWPTDVGDKGTTTVDGGANWLSQGQASGALSTGYWTYAYAYGSSTTPDISSASPLSVPIIEAPSSYISISGAGTTQPGVDEIIIYRTLRQSTNVVVTGVNLHQIAILPIPANGGSWSYVDSSQDPPDPSSTMNLFTFADTVGTNTPAPLQLTNFVYHLGRLWGSVGNVVYASAGPDVINSGNPFTAFPPDNFFTFPAGVVRMLATPQGLLVFTTDQVQIINGLGASASSGFSGFSTFIPNVYTNDVTLGNYDGLTTDGSTIYIYTVDNNVVSISPSGLSWLSSPISNKLQSSFQLKDGTTVTFSPLAATLSWYINGDDYGLFLSDGTYGWFRMMPSTAPDAGNMVWSPFAKISGGVSVVQYLETDINGTHNLLIAPGVSGPILKRDKSVFTDNGTTFSWYATIGSIILAHPNEIALLQAIVIDSVKTGSHPTITVWYDEINSSGTNVTYTNPVYDPYSTPVSTTVNADRFYLSDVSSVAVCRHIQFSINFPAENFGNTVLATTIIGAMKYDN